jgi:hypothetical protein
MRTIDLQIGDVGITHGPFAGADLLTITAEQLTSLGLSDD